MKNLESEVKLLDELEKAYDEKKGKENLAAKRKQEQVVRQLGGRKALQLAKEKETAEKAKAEAETQKKDDK